MTIRILTLIDFANFAVLDLLAAFDTIDHDIFVCRLQKAHGMSGKQGWASNEFSREKNVIDYI